MTLPAGTAALGIERIVWHNEITKGIFHKHIIEIGFLNHLMWEHTLVDTRGLVMGLVAQRVYQ
jgi:hypothetical protein